MKMPELLNPEIYQALDLAEFVAVDLETTGLDCQSSEIIEVGAVKFVNGEVAETLHFLVKPRSAIPETITRITGLTDDDVKDAPAFEDILDTVLDFTDGLPIVAHNARFDLSFLEYHARKARRDDSPWNPRNIEYRMFPNQQIDTVLLTRMYFPYLSSYSLEALVDHFSIDRTEGHRAVPDATAAGHLLLHILNAAVSTKLADAQKILAILAPTDDPIKRFFEKLALFASSGRFHVPAEQGIDRRKFDIQANLYNIIGGKKEGQLWEDRKDPIDVESVGGFFDTEGELSKEFAAFEVRHPQIEMARAIAEALNQSKLLIAEAGTGTGKSMAYLVPAIRWAIKNYGPLGRVVISTNTKNLQEQLFYKDMPILHSVLEDDFKAVLLKGKGNYLCLDKWAMAMSDMQSRLTPSERTRMLPLYFWVQETETGDIAENTGFRAERNIGLWSKFIAENNYCPGKSCKYYDKCFLMRARNQARNAHLVLVNHSLLFSDLAADNAILGEYANVILDEAHNIEKTATEYLGSQVTLWQFRDFLNKLYSRERFETGALVQLRRKAQSGKLKEQQLNYILQQAETLIDKVTEVRQLMQDFFKSLTRHLRERSDGSKEYSSKQRYQNQSGIFEPLIDQYANFAVEMKSLQTRLVNFIEYLKELPEESFEYQRQIFQDLNAQVMQAELLRTNLEFLLTSEEDEFVYWYELPYRSESDDTRLYAAPLDVGTVLNERLFSQLNAAVFTSATLAVDKRFDYFKKRVGLDRVTPERLETLLLDSPFSYKNQVLLAVPSFLANPSDFRYMEQLKAMFEQLAKDFKRGTLALFTSYHMLNSIYKAIRPVFEEENIPLMGQGIDGGRHVIINRFKKNENGFLLGTDSFWEGVDIPGKALEMVILTKLPFDVPSEPIIQARSDLIKSQGGNAFKEFALPEAVIRFRQGFGRLIRTQSDSGVILVLDNRVSKKFYGQVFLNSLPSRPEIFDNPESFWERLANWYGADQRG